MKPASRDVYRPPSHRSRAGIASPGFWLLLASALFLVLAALPAAAFAREPGDEPFERVRALYLAAVEQPEAVTAGLAEIEALTAEASAILGPSALVTLRAYEGALLTLRAKHGVWPPRRLAQLREGFAILDQVVSEHPEHAEARYLRLMSGYYLPGVLGRTQSVREDFAALARLLPGVRADYPPDLYDAIVRFVLEKGAPEPAAARALEAALAADG